MKQKSMIVCFVPQHLLQKKQIASIMHTKSHQVKLQIGMTQFQENSLDCGVYVITFATDLCHGNDPSQVKI